MVEKKQPRPADPLIDDVRKTRHRLVQEHGGLEGWLEHLRALQQEHPEKLISRGKHTVP